MVKEIELFKERVETLEKDYASFERTNEKSISQMKERVLKLLRELKHNQDEPGNEEHEDFFEDLIYRVIIILGEL